MTTTPNGGAVTYLHGFGNEHHSEALPGALPWGQNSPQQVPYGLYTEQISASAFTAPREVNRRTWMYRITPTAAHTPFQRIERPRLQSAPIPGFPTPNRQRWNALPRPSGRVDFVDGLYTLAANGDVLDRVGMAIHLYAITSSMTDRYFSNSDGELLVVPQAGALRIRTELGVIEAVPGEIAVIGRSLKFAVDLIDDTAAGYVCENYGEPFELPELGPIGANGLAYARDFRYPVASYEERSDSVQWVQKFGGALWATELDHSPLDVVAWHGTHGAYVYDLADFVALGNLTVDHPDPSVFTVLTSRSGSHPGQANVDFCALGTRWIVAEHTFRPPHFHRNIMAEFMGLIHGVHDSKAAGFVPGGASLHNTFAAHGPDLKTYELGIAAGDEPVRFDNSLAFMFETRLPLVVTDFADSADHRQTDYDTVWSDLRTRFTPPARHTSHTRHTSQSKEKS